MDANNIVFCVLWLVSRTFRFFFIFFLRRCYRVGMVRSLDIMRRVIGSEGGIGISGLALCGFDRCAENTISFFKPPNG